MRSEACGCPKVRFADLHTPAGGPRDLVLRVTMTPASNEVDAGSRRECRTTASTGPGRKIATVERREAGVLSSLGNAGRRKHGARMPVMACTTGCSQHPGACRRSAIPSSGWQQKKRIGSREGRKRKEKKEIFRRVGKGAGHTRDLPCDQWSTVPTRKGFPRGGVSRGHGAQQRRVDRNIRQAPLPTLRGCLTSFSR
jgi:hypothetical protein